MANNQLTVEQRRDVVRASLVQEVERLRAEIGPMLKAFDIDFDIFVAGLQISLARIAKPEKAGGDPEFFDKVTSRSFIEANFRAALNGLLPDGKESAIGRFGDQATFMPMRGGFVKILWRSGLIKSINDNIVTEEEYKADRFEYEEGTDGFIRHKPDLMRKDTDPVVAAYCVIEMVGGGMMREVVVKDELEKIAGKSKSPARREWRHQMDRKAAIRRIMGKMPQNAAIRQVLTHDEDNFDMTLKQEPEADKPVPKGIFSNKAKAPKLPKPKDEPKPEPDDVDTTDTGNADARTEADGADEFVLKALLRKDRGVQEFEHVDFWVGDIQQHVKRLPQAERSAFWDTNADRIKAAMPHYPEQVKKLRVFAAEWSKKADE